MIEITAELTNETVVVDVFDEEKLAFTREFSFSPVTIGRDAENAMMLPYSPISRNHCVIYKAAGKWFIQDDKSRNGISQNGKRAEKIELTPDSHLEIAGIKVRIRILTAEQVNQDENLKPKIVESGMDRPVFSVPSAPPVSPRPASKGGANLAPIVPSVPTSFQVASFEAPKSNSPALKIAESWQPEGEAHVHEDEEPELVVPFDTDRLLLSRHQGAQKTNNRHVEVVVTWRDQVLTVEEFPPGLAIYFEFNGKFYNLGTVGRDQTVLRVPSSFKVAEASVVSDQAVAKPTQGNSHRQKGPVLKPDQVVCIENAYVKFAVRYIPAPFPLSRASMPVPEADMISPLIVSTSIHGSIAFAIFWYAPSLPTGPKIKDVPERFARLIVQKPPEPTPPPAPTPPPPTPPPLEPPKPPEVAKAEPEKVKPKPKKLKLKPHKEPVQAQHKVEPPQPKTISAPPPSSLAERNKLPLKVDTRPAFEVKKVGALSAFAALNPSTSVNPALTSVKIEKASGHGSSASTGNVFSALKETSTNVGGMGNGAIAMQTKNVGYGGGGLKGKAGKRNVEGAVVGKVDLQDFSKSEGLTREQVVKVVEKYHSQIQQCYERSLIDNPSLAGRAEFEWLISPAGAVSDINVKDNNMKNSGALIDCIKNVFAKMKFPKAVNGESTSPTIGFPFGRL